MLKIYFCAFKQEYYLEEAKISIKSLQTNGQFNGPIYLFTDMDVIIENVEVFKVNCGSIPLSASFRTRIFDYIKDYDSNDIFLYLDTDIVIDKQIPSFNYIDDKIHVYGYSTRNQSGNSFSGNITNDPHFILKPAICTGILLFRPSLKVKNVFDETYELYKILLADNKVNACWEQPALCYKMIEHTMYNMSLNNYVIEERGGEHSIKNKKDAYIFNHFCGLRSTTRFKKMANMLNIRQ